MAAVANVSVSNPFHMATQRINVNASIPPPSASSSRSPPPTPSSIKPAPEAPERSFNRFRSSLEQTLRTATRSRNKPTPQPSATVDEFATIGKGKEKANEEAPKEKSRMLRRLESKVNFRRAGKETLAPTDSSKSGKDADEDPIRAAGFTSAFAPSLRQASMSSPTLHLSATTKPRSPIPISTRDAPTLTRTRTSSMQPSSPRDIGTPAPLSPRRDSRSNGNAISGSSQPSREPSRHRSTKSTPPVFPSSPSAVSLNPRGSLDSPQTPSRRNRDPPSPPTTPTPMSGSRGHLARSSSRSGAYSSSHLPLSGSPQSPRGTSPIPIGTPSRSRVSSPTQRHLSSSSISSSPKRPSFDSAHRPSIDSQRRPSVDSQRRTSIDSQRRPSAEYARRASDSPTGMRGTSPAPPRSRGLSPPSSPTHNRHFNMANMSTTSLISPPNSEQRELIRTATSLLCKEMTKPPPHLTRTESGSRDWEEVELRMRALSRLERIWGKSGGVIGGSSSQLTVSAANPMGSGGEERERRLFCEALRDGFVLCQLLNKVRSSSVVRPDTRDDGFIRTSNVTKFLAACSSLGLSSSDLFLGDDLIEASGESLGRVAHTIVTLVKFVETPVLDRSKFISGQAKKLPSITIGTSPYGNGTVSRGAASTPNLSAAQLQRSTSPAPPSPARAKRWSPPQALPTVRSNSPDEGTSGSNSDRKDRDAVVARGSDRESRDTPIMTPPPKSPLRARSPKHVDDDGVGLFTFASSPDRVSVADSTRAVSGDSVRASFADSSFARQSIASTAVTDTTAYSSLLDARRNSSSGHNKYGTVRTMTTDITSEAPSFTRAEGSAVAAFLTEELGRKRGLESGSRCSRDRKSSETPGIDLSRVAEETEESGSSSKGHTSKTGNAREKQKASDVENERDKEKDRDRERIERIQLGKGKWPEDFMDLPSRSKPLPIPRKSSPSSEDLPYTSSPLSVSPPRKLAIVGASRRTDSSESIPLAPRRPTHRARHSVDAPVLLPKESVFGRDSSPDGVPPPTARVMLRRHSTKPGIQRNGVYIPRGGVDDPRNSGDSDSLVPFPRTVSGEHGANTPGSSSDGRQSGAGPSFMDKPRPPRGRFQSDIESASSSRRARPNSYDDAGAKPSRSRFESMVNLGVASDSASASDLISRNSMDGSAVRKTLIVKEEGKPPTHFQLGNCIGRGQFGSVYRALNLNTGQMVAVKRIRLEGLKEDEVMQLMKEVDLVKSLSHPSIVKYEGMARDDDTLSIVLEYAENGSLGQILKAFGKLNERLVASYVVKILEGLHYLHGCDVVHCDLKAANILTTKNGNVKLSDFGVSLNLRAMKQEMKDVQGTPNWMAPEVIELKGASTKSDIWSLACTVIELLTGKPPYAEIANSMSVMFRIVEDDMPLIPEGCSELLQDFLTQCFNKDPKKRPSADILCEHQWLKKNWGAHKQLRPQDSIPFLRRVSADLQKSEAVRYLSQIEMPDSHDHAARVDELISSSPPRRRLSSSTPRPSLDNDPISPREHTFVKTSFSKPMICRVCMLNVKKNAVLCAQCSLISHTKCAINAPPTCDLRSQLLLYAQYAEKGNPASAYSNPMEILDESLPTSPMSDVAYVAHTPRTSLDTPTAHSPPPVSPTLHPPTAFKFMAAFKRSKSNLTVDSSAPSDTSSVNQPAARGNVVGQRSPEPLERPQSLASNSTNPNTSSMRSAATAAESFSSRHGPSRQSAISINETEAGTRMSDSHFSAPESERLRSSRMISISGSSSAHAAVEPDESRANRIPGEMPPDTRRLKKREPKSSACTVQ